MRVVGADKRGGDWTQYIFNAETTDLLIVGPDIPGISKRLFSSY